MAVKMMAIGLKAHRGGGNMCFRLRRTFGSLCLQDAKPVKQPWLQRVTGEVEGLAMLHSATRADQVQANDSEARQGRCKDNPGCEWHPAS